jgi:CRP/FNR family transcriptional regulator, nitrogen oxide reductase regulator
MADIPVTTEVLGGLPMFKKLETRALRTLLDRSHIRRVEESSFFFFQGDPARYLYILTLGRIKMTQVTPDGQEIILKVIAPVTMFGGVAMIAEQAYPVSAQALEDSQALAWRGDELRRLAEDYPRLALNAMGLMAEHAQDFQDRYRELATERVERRIARLVLRLAQQVGKKTERGVLIDLAISRQEMAEMSGTTLYTVSRTLTAWEKQGLVETGREKVIILKPHQLVQIAEDLPID